MGKVGTALHPEEPKIFAPPPRSGEVTPYAQKLAAELAVILLSLIVVVNTPQMQSPGGVGFAAIALAIVVMIVVSIIFFVRVVYVDRQPKDDQVNDNMLCTPMSELWAMLGVSVLWIPIVWLTNSALLTDRGVHGLVQVFAWFGLGASMFATFKAHQQNCEDIENNVIHYYDLNIGSQAGAEMDDAQYR